MERKPVSSSAIKAIGYDGEKKTLEVEFHSGGVCQYDNVTPAMHEALTKAGSVGSHFNTHYRDMPYRKIK